MNDGYADFVKLNFESQNESLTIRQEFTFTKSADTVLLSGTDDYGHTLNILSSDAIVVTIDGVEVASSDYTRSVSSIILASAIKYTSKIVVTCYEHKTLTSLTLTFKKVSEIVGKSETLVSDEQSSYTSLFSSSWNDVAKLTQVSDVYINYFTEDLETLTISMDDFKLASMELVFMYRYKKPVLSQYNVWKTYDGYTDSVLVTEKTILSNIPGFVLLGDTPYAFEDKNENETISISKLQSYKTMIEYNSGVDLTIQSSTVQKIFPPFDISTRNKNVTRTVVSTNTTVNNKNQNIIGPV